LVQCILIFRRAGDRGRLFRLLLAPALALAFQAQMIECTVPRQSEQPRNKRASGGLITTGVTPELQENVLYNLFGRGTLLQDAENQRINNARMAIVELFERAHVPF